MNTPAVDENHEHERTAGKPIRWAFFNTDIRNRYNHGEIIRFLDAGISFKTDHHLKPGTNVLIKLQLYEHDERNDDADSEEFPYCKTGEVVSCHEILAPYSHSYEVGVKYHTWSGL